MSLREKIFSGTSRRHACRRRPHGQPGSPGIFVSDGTEKYRVCVAAPILTEGDVMGCVLFFSDNDAVLGEVEYKLAQTVAAFLGRQMEN